MENKKRSILENLNGHLQIQATRLMNVGLETNILPDNKTQISNNKKVLPIANSRNFLYKTYTNVKPSVTFKKSNGNTTKVRKLRPYDPLYTWNRGGRLKELRIRCQARKFLYLWRNKTIGRISYLTANRHYQRQLVKMAWKTWYDLYWDLRIEPRFFGRAILYRKAVLVRLVFSSWLWWTKSRSVTRIKVDIAIEFYETHIKKFTFNNWVSWIFVSKCKNRLNILSESHARKQALSHTFRVWKDEFRYAQENNTKMVVAQSHHKLVLTSKVWHHWKTMRPYLRHSQLTRLKALNNYQSTVVRRLFDRWMNFHHERKLKNKEMARWNNHYNWNLAHRYLGIWRDKYSRALAQSAITMRTKELATRFQMRKCFIGWRTYIADRKLQLCAVRIVDEWREGTIKRKVLSAIKSYLLRAREKRKLRQTARASSDRFILRRYLSKWVAQLEEKDNHDRQIELGAARSHYRHLSIADNRYLFRKHLRQWSQYTTFAVESNRKAMQADEIYKNHLMIRSVKCWVQFTKTSQYRKSMTTKQNNFLREAFIRKYWNEWRHKYHERKLLDQRLVEVLKEQEFKRRKYIFRKWNLATDSRIKNRNNDNKALAHYRCTLMNKCFMALMAHVRHKENEKLNLDLACVHSQQRIMLNVLRGWRERFLKKQYHRQLLVSRFQKIQRKIKSIVFSSWRAIVQNKLMIRAIADEMFLEKKRQIVLKTFQTWNDNAKNRRHKRHETSLIVHESKVHLDEYLKENILQKWRQLTLLSVSEGSKKLQAEKLFRQTYLKKFFAFWLQYHKEQKVKDFQRQQSFWFWQKSEQIRTWLVWRRSLADRQREQYYTRFALVHWSHTLQRTVFLAWMNYATDRKETSSRETDAFSLYKSRLKAYTVRQWLTSADFLDQWRHRQCRTGGTDSNVVAKAFRHWKEFSVTKRTNSQPPRHILKTFCPETENINLVQLQRKALRVSKLRPQPKVPAFLLNPRKPEVRFMKEQFPGELPKKEETPRSHIPFEHSDDVLLAPVCFEHDSADNTGSQRQQKNECDLFKEITRIKDRLLQFKETADILKNLRSELAEYDSVLTKLTPSNDSSFYREFNPLSYRDRLVNNIADLEVEISREKPVCQQLSVRFQEIMRILHG